jgi:hypothetical protein
VITYELRGVTILLPKSSGFVLGQLYLRKTFLIITIMKQRIKLLVVMLLIVALGFSAHRIKSNRLVAGLDEVEALAWCEITSKDNKVKLVCSGNAGLCSYTYLGYTLTCNGTKVKP